MRKKICIINPEQWKLCLLKNWSILINSNCFFTLTKHIQKPKNHFLWNIFRFFRKLLTSKMWMLGLGRQHIRSYPLCFFFRLVVIWSSWASFCSYYRPSSSRAKHFASKEVVAHGVWIGVPVATHTTALRLSTQTMIRRAECSRSIAVPMVCLSWTCVLLWSEINSFSEIIHMMMIGYLLFVRCLSS